MYAASWRKGHADSLQGKDNLFEEMERAANNIDKPQKSKIFMNKKKKGDKSN